MKKIKNSTLLIIAGFVFVIMGLGYFIIQSMNGSTIKRDGDVILSNDEAVALSNDKTLKLIDIYENQSKVFTIKTPEEESIYNEVENYEKVIKSFFSENGIKQLEETKFDGKEFVVKEEDKIKLLKTLPEDNIYKDSNISIEIMSIKKDSIISKVTFTSYKLKDDVVTYYVIVKDLEMIKKNNEWLIDSFSYPNE